MTGLFSGYDTSAVAGVTPDNQETGWWAATNAHFGLAARENMTTSQFKAYKPYSDERAKRYEELTGQKGNFMHTWFPEAEIVRNKLSELVNRGELHIGQDGGIQAESKEAEMYRSLNPDEARAALEIDRLSKLYPGEFLTDAEIDLKVAEDLRLQRERDQSIIARNRDLTPALAGTGSALALDPMVIATLPLGYGVIQGGTLIANAGKAFLSEAAIAMGAEIPIQMVVSEFRKKIGNEMTLGEAAFNVLSASIGAGAIRATGSIGIDSISKLLGKVDEVQLHRALTDAELDAKTKLGNLLHVLENSPLNDANAHVRAWHKAVADVESLRPVDVDPIVRGFESDVASSQTIEDFISSLLPVAGSRLSRGDRMNLGREIKDLEFKIAEREPRVTAKPPGKKLSASAKKAQAAKRKAQQDAVEKEVGDLKAQLAVLNGQLKAHTRAMEANKTLTRIEEMQRAKTPAEDIEKKVGIKKPEPEKVEPEEILTDLLKVLREGDVPARELRRVLSNEQGVRDIAKKAGLDDDQANTLLAAVQGRGAKETPRKESPQVSRVIDEDGDVPVDEMDADIDLAQRLIDEEDPDIPVAIEKQGGDDVVVQRKAGDVLTEIREFQEAIDVVAKCNA